MTATENRKLDMSLDEIIRMDGIKGARRGGGGFSSGNRRRGGPVGNGGGDRRPYQPKRLNNSPYNRINNNRTNGGSYGGQQNRYQSGGNRSRQMNGFGGGNRRIPPCIFPTLLQALILKTSTNYFLPLARWLVPMFITISTASV